MMKGTKARKSTIGEMVLAETDLVLQKGLPAKEVDRRLVALARAHRRAESALSYYLKDVDERQLYLQYGHGNTIDYARERLGFEERKTRSLLNIARSFEKLPNLNSAFRRGDIPWTKAREVAKVAKPETDREWLVKTQSLSNRQLEKEVRQTLPPVRKKTLVLVLEGERLDAWEQTREACERLAGTTEKPLPLAPKKPGQDSEGLRVRETQATYGGDKRNNVLKRFNIYFGDHVISKLGSLETAVEYRRARGNQGKTPMESRANAAGWWTQNEALLES
jgi:hypothetical protein